MFINLNIQCSVPRKLETPIHGTTETVPSNCREQVFREHLRWFLHSRWCVTTTSRRKICNDSRCQQLRPMFDHIRTCEETSFCNTLYCNITRECLAYFISCKDDDCCKCKPMKYAFFGRFLPDVEIYPQPPLDYISKRDRGKRIRQIVRAFYPNPDYTDLQDERLEKEICRARIIEAHAYRHADSIPAYKRFIRSEIRKIQGPMIV
ncbi:hypothetical protein Aperf_G00000096316 [Anoplocephala perfoliata]